MADFTGECPACEDTVDLEKVGTSEHIETGEPIDQLQCQSCGGVFDRSEVEGQTREDDSYDLGEKRPLDHGSKIRAKVKRGTGTRDQDELLIEGRGEDAEEAADDFEAALTRVENKEWVDRLRELQPLEVGDADE